MSIQEIKVPPLGESVSEATIATWHKKAGDAVKADELLVELETDKVTLEVNAPADGKLVEIKAKEGDNVEVGNILATFEEGAAGSAPAKEEEAAAPSKKEEAPAPTAKSNDNLSPAPRKIIAEKNLNPADITGTGKDGRVTKGDALAASQAPQAQSAAPQDNANRTERVKMSRLRQRIAERLKESQNTAAILTTFNEVDMSGIMNLRNKYKEDFQKKHNVKLGFMSFFAKAVVAALKEIPSVNAEIDGTDVIYKNFYDIGVAVGTEQGLVVPVVRNCDQLSIAGIEQEINNLALKARDGKLSMADLTGGTFTISNGGVYGSLLSTPIINPPQSAILGMHKTEQKPVVINGEIVIRPMMYLALSYDHRIIDGKEAVTFLVKVKQYLEDPSRLLLDM
jgi:2-oxoglutarate dehydrogenase E2 component (dihydrolipoamide succinyltransferase)